MGSMSWDESQYEEEDDVANGVDDIGDYNNNKDKEEITNNKEKFECLEVGVQALIDDVNDLNQKI